MDKISVIVPVYNVEKYLEECLESIQKQTYKNLEIIIIDDGSTDNSGRICDEYAKKDDRIKVIHQLNQGLSEARNVGIQNATGRYIGFVDSDDYIDIDMYNMLITNMKREDADISCCSSLKVYKNKIKINKKNNCYGCINSEKAIKLLCEGHFIRVSVYTKLYKREIFENIRFPKGKKSEDIYVSYKLLDLADKIVYTSIQKYYYRQRIGSITNSGNINLDAIEASKEMVEFVRKKYPNIVSSAIKSYIYTSIGVYDNIIIQKDNKNDEIKDNILSEIKEDYSIIVKDNTISKARKAQLFLIRHSPHLYNCCFKLFYVLRNYIEQK